MKKILPATLLEQGAAAYHMKIAVKSQVIYWVILLAITGTFCSLPFIYTDVSVQGGGVLQSSINRQRILAPVSGRITAYNLRDNQPVNKGDVLVKIETTGIEAVQASRHGRVRELEAALRDIQLLRSGASALTPAYVAAQQRYQARLAEADNRLKQATVSYQRNEPLYRERVISATEFEKTDLEYKQAQAAYNLVRKEQSASWEAEGRELQRELRDLQGQDVQAEQDKLSYTIAAPLKGTLLEVTPMQPGTYVYANQQLGEIVPDSGLIALLYIPPSKIGLIRLHQPVKLRIDAFPHFEWGTVPARVTDIAADVSVSETDGHTFFKVKCRLEKKHLSLSNGYKGNLVKGMTLQAHLVVARRSLYQLIYDTAADWLSPHQHAK
jgi:HlyD family secretion protein